MLLYLDHRIKGPHYHNQNGGAPKLNGTLNRGNEERQQRENAEEDGARPVTLVSTSSYSRRCRARLTPGINPPCFIEFSAKSIGLKMIDV